MKNVRCNAWSGNDFSKWSQWNVLNLKTTTENETKYEKIAEEKNRNQSKPSMRVQTKHKSSDSVHEGAFLSVI